MPLFKKHNLLFVHIPKTGGSSIEKYFGVYHKKDWSHLWHSEEQTINNIRFAPQHFPTYHLKKIIGQEDYSKLFKFTFVRNPYTRVLSEYGFQRKTYNVKKPINDWIRPFYLAQDSDHTLPQSYFIDDSIQFIGKFESLQADFDSILERNNIEKTGELKKTNISKHRSKLEDINQSNIRFINDFFKEDFLQFKYGML